MTKLLHLLFKNQSGALGCGGWIEGCGGYGGIGSGGQTGPAGHRKKTGHEYERAVNALTVTTTSLVLNKITVFSILQNLDMTQLHTSSDYSTSTAATLKHLNCIMCLPHCDVSLSHF